MGRNDNKQDQDIHDRHAADTSNDAPAEDAAGASEEAEQSSNDKPKLSWPGKDAKEQQAARDAHFKENGVKADLTGGTVPESEQ